MKKIENDDRLSDLESKLHHISLQMPLWLVAFVFFGIVWLILYSVYINTIALSWALTTFVGEQVASPIIVGLVYYGLLFFFAPNKRQQATERNTLRYMAIALLIASAQTIVSFWLLYESDYGVFQIWATGVLVLVTCYSAVLALLLGVEA